LRKAQAGIRRLVERDLANFWSHLDLSKPERALLHYVPLLVQRHGESAAALAADWYDEVRAASGVPGRFRAVMADSPYLDGVDGTAHRAVGGLFTDHPETTLTTLTATAPKYVLGAGRQTILTSAARDPRASGWQRVGSGSSCRFCTMLIGRGAVYRDRTAHFAAHKACDCAAVPSWDPDAPEVEAELYQASRRTSRMSPKQREKHNALIRDALDRYVPVD
jgi:hypothetical protein